MNERLIELKVLNCLMVDEHSSYFSKIDEGDFFHPESKRLFGVLLKINDTGKSIDVGQVVDDYSYLVGSDDVGFDYVQSVLDSLVTTASIDTHVDALQTISKKRALKHVCQKALEDSQDSRADLSEILQEVERGITEISRQKEDSSVKTAKQAVVGALHTIEAVIRGDVGAIGHSTGLTTIDAFLAFKGGEMVVIGARPSIGKCLGKDTPVLMYGGNIKMSQDVKEGDLLTGPDGNPRKVALLVRGNEEMYRITPNKGDPYTVNESHILSFKLNSDGTKWAKIYAGNKYYPRDIVNLSVQDYLGLCGRKKHHLKGWKAEAIDFPTKYRPIELPPYALGVWLGDGSNTKPVIYTPEPEIEDYLDEFANSIGCCLSESQQRGCKALYISTGRTGGTVRNPFFKALKIYDLPGDKHIPHDYLTGTIKNRLELLAGLLDTDGYYNGAGLYEIITKYKKLNDGIVFLCNSLGFRVCSKLVKKGIKSTGFVGEYHRINITGDVAQIPVKVHRKKATGYKPKRDMNTSGIKVEKIGKGDYYGWSLEGPDKLFLLGDFTVTHNSALAGVLARNLSDAGVNVYLGTLEMKAEDFMQRLIYTSMGVNQYTVKDLSRGDLEGRLIKATDKLSKSSIWFDDVGRDWAGIKRRIRRAVRNVGVQVAFIDYLQLIQIKGDFFSRENQVATISGEIKALALELDITIVILAQLNREAEGKNPSMRDLRESGAIEQDADVVALLSREREGESPDAERIEACLHIVKYRNGRTGKADLWFYPGLTNFIARIPTMLLPNEWEKE